MRVLSFLGDSHLRPVKAAFQAGLFYPYECRIEEVGGATAVGLRHPTSKTQALVVYRERLSAFDPCVVPVFQLGEVDCGFVIWVRAQRYGESVQDQLNASLKAYASFLVDIRDQGYRDLVVTSATLPTIRDNQLSGEVALLRAEVAATQRDRTDLTIEYNERLSDICHREGLNFVCLDKDLLDPETRLIHEKFRHSDPKDHHLNPATAGPLWAMRVLEVVRDLK